MVDMSDFIESYASIMRAQLDRLDSVSQNVSNLNTPGYLSETSVLNKNEFKELVAGQRVGVSVEKHFSATGGAIKSSGINSHFALSDNVWFVLASDTDVLLTRNGEFNLTDAGALEHRSGHALMGEAGALAGLPTDFEVSRSGGVSSSAGVIDHISVASVPVGTKLEAMGGGVYKAGKSVVPADKFTLVQGALNLSNVDNAENMIKMMEITRHVQTLQRAMSAYDGLMDSAINELGK